KKGVDLGSFHCIAALAGTISPLSHASNQLAWFTGSTENSHLLKRSIVRFRRRARNVSSFVSSRLGLSSGAGRRGPECASDRHIGGGCPGFSAWYPAPRVYDIYIQLCPGDTVEARPPSVLLSRHALVPGVFQWSSSLRRSRVRDGHLQRPPTLYFK
ncbi:unnamed protein product, partial [Dovyalis caffra]